MKNLSFKYLFLLFLALASCDVSFAEVIVNASFRPGVVAHGDSTQYVIEFKGEQGDLAGAVPHVEGLDISNNASVSSSVQIINWEREASITYSFPVRPIKKGSFTIPEWKGEYGGKEVIIPAATLKVVEQSDEMKNALILQLVGLDNDIYIGETVDATLRMLIRSDLNLAGGGLPTKVGDSFSCSEFTDNYDSKKINLDGTIYSVLSWPVHLTALKSGEQKLKFNQEIVLEFRKEASARRRMSIFDDPFRRMTERKQMTVYSEDYKINVLDVPEENKPEGFTGALGQFEVEREVSPNKVTVGEPVSIKLTISGSGNFSRISAPELENTENWKVYPPKSDFIGSDDYGFEGTKVFEYVLIPEKETLTEVPKLRFSYFNPSEKAYRNIEFDPYPINVLSAPDAPTAFLSIKTDTAKPDKVAIKKELKLLPLRLIEEKSVFRLKPLYHSRTLWLLQLLPFITLLSIIYVRHRKLRFDEDESYARRHYANKGVRQQLKTVKDAASVGNHAAFYEAARGTIQQALIQHFPRGQNADSLTLLEVESVLDTESLSEVSLTFIRDIFNAADAIKFAGSAFEEDDLASKRSQLEKLLGEIN